MTAQTKLERTTFQLSGPQLTWLRKEAKKLGVTMGEFLRRILDEKREAK